MRDTKPVIGIEPVHLRIRRNVPDSEMWERVANVDAAGLGDLVNEGLLVASRCPQSTRLPVVAIMPMLRY